MPKITKEDLPNNSDTKEVSEDKTEQPNQVPEYSQSNYGTFKWLEAAIMDPEDTDDKPKTAEEEIQKKKWL